MTNRGFAAIGLDRCKSKENLGGALRAAGCYGASMVAISGARMGKYSTDTMRAYRHIPCLEVATVMDAIPFGASLVVVELCERAIPIKNFVHPEAAFYVFGPEDGSVKNEVIASARHVIYIPTKACMNLAATVNVVLFDRLMKAREAA